MRGIFGLVGLLVVLAVVGTVVRNQMRVARPLLPVPVPTESSSAPAHPEGNTAAQIQQVQQQFKQAVEGAVQPRPMPDDK